MDKIKQYVALTVVGALAIVAAGWFLLVKPKRTEAADLRQQAAAELATNEGLRTQLTRLKAQAKDLPKKQAELARIETKIPNNPGLPALVRALTKAADDAGVELVSMAPAQPTLVQAAAAAAATAATGAAGATGVASGTAASTPTATGAAPAAAAAPAVNVGQLQSINVQLNVVGGFFQVEQFFDRVEALSRAMKITNFTLAHGSNPLKQSTDTAATNTASGRILNTTLTGVVYLASGRTTITPNVPAK